METNFAKNVLMLAPSRFLGKRFANFFRFIDLAGHQVRLAAIPRLKWNLSGLEPNSDAVETHFMTLTKKNTKPQIVPDVVICGHWLLLPVAILIKVLFGSRILYEEDDCYELMFASLGRSRQLRALHIINLFYRVFLRFCDLCTCVHLKDNAHRRNLNRFSDNILELNNYSARCWQRKCLTGVSGNQAITFVYSGKLVDVKGCGLAARAFVKAKQNLPDFNAELHFFSAFWDKDLADRLERQDDIYVHKNSSAESLIKFLHGRQAVGLLLYQDRMYYRYIGTNSMKIYEYLACGVPVIATRMGEIESFLHTDNIGYLVESDISEDDLAELFVKIAGNPLEVQEKGINAARLMSNPDMCWESEWAKVVETGIFNGVLDYSKTGSQLMNKRH